MDKTYKFRIYPNQKQQEQIAVTFDAVRYVYNFFLTKSMELYEKEKKYMTTYGMIRDLTALKNQEIWLKQADKWALQNALKNLNKAYTRYFKEKDKPGYVKYTEKTLARLKRIGREPSFYDSSWHPKYKQKNDKRRSYTTQNSFGSTQTQPPIDVNNHKIKLPKLGWVKIRDSLDIQGRILHATIEQNPSGEYYVYLGCTEVEVIEFSKTNRQIGIDLGIKNFITYSDGRKESSMEFLKEDLIKIQKLHKELDRKEKNSSNWEKSRIKLAKAYEHLSNKKTDYLQKLSTEIIREYDVICVEDLDVQGLKDGATGSNKEKSSLRKEINLCGWGEFLRMLEYKAKWYGKELHMVDKYYPSSQICHICGYKNAKLKDREIREWICPECGEKHDRDVNAAINILKEGLKQRKLD